MDRVSRARPLRAHVAAEVARVVVAQVPIERRDRRHLVLCQLAAGGRRQVLEYYSTMNGMFSSKGWERQ